MKGYVAAILKRHDFPAEWGQTESRNPISQYNCGRETDLALERERGEKLIFYELISSWFS